MKINENQWKSMNINENQWTSMKINERSQNPSVLWTWTPSPAAWRQEQWEASLSPSSWKAENATNWRTDELTRNWLRDLFLKTWTIWLRVWIYLKIQSNLFRFSDCRESPWIRSLVQAQPRCICFTWLRMISHELQVACDQWHTSARSDDQPVAGHCFKSVKSLKSSVHVSRIWDKFEEELIKWFFHCFYVHYVYSWVCHLETGSKGVEFATNMSCKNR